MVEHYTGAWPPGGGVKVVGSSIRSGAIIASLRGASLERNQFPQIAATATATVPKAVNPSIMCVTTTETLPIACETGMGGTSGYRVLHSTGMRCLWITPKNVMVLKSIGLYRRLFVPPTVRIIEPSIERYQTRVLSEPPMASEVTLALHRKSINSPSFLCNPRSSTEKVCIPDAR
jgi:hypothetical protein